MGKKHILLLHQMVLLSVLLDGLLMEEWAFRVYRVNILLDGTFAEKISRISFAHDLGFS